MYTWAVGPSDLSTPLTSTSPSHTPPSTTLPEAVVSAAIAVVASARLPSTHVAESTAPSLKVTEPLPWRTPRLKPPSYLTERRSSFLCFCSRSLRAA